ncbi:MAG: BLUF domain-containing protein [Spirochaetia bacterium]|nr:BLUF domain-containing protein [Spirochaetia bacterium]
MKRLTYISAFSKDLSRAEVAKIEEVSIRNNKRDGLTGALFCFRDLFYQVIEGDEADIDRCYTRILKDPRHKDIFCLNVETNITQRLYGDWAMKTVVLEDSQEELLLPIRNLMDSMARTHFILGKYAPERVISDIQSGVNPLLQRSFHTERIVLFADIMASTTLTEALRTEVIAGMLDRFYDLANGAILAEGGTISKLTGDGMMSYFPIDKPDHAIRASLRILRELGEYRNSLSPDDKRGLLYAGIGISAGKVLEGSIGSEDRKDYTLLGDPVNSAARLESVTRKVGYGLVFDSRLRNLLSHDVVVKKLGMYQPKGKTIHLEIFTLPVPEAKLDQTSQELRERILGTRAGAAA